ASRDVSISGRLSWQSEASAFLLGRLRPRCDAILGPDRAETPRRDTELPRLGDGAGVQPRGQQLRVLARRQRGGLLLFLRLSRTGRLCGAQGSAKRRLLRRGSR